MPWVLVGLVAVAGSAGALVGIANQQQVQSAQLSMSAIASGTRAAGTARFTYSAITSSPNPLLRSTTYGRGTVDFKTQSLATVERYRETSLESSGSGPSQPTTQTTVNSQIWIGTTNYNNFNTVGFGSDDSWMNNGSSPVNTLGTFGIFSNVGPIGALAEEASIPGGKVVDLGSEVLGDTFTTRYRLVVPTCDVPETGFPQIVFNPTDIWIDGQGRLVQARSVLRITWPKNFRLPKSILNAVPQAQALAAPGPFAGQSTTISSIRLFDFGAPVAISAPDTVDSTASGGAIGNIAVQKTQSRNGCGL
jgi:hypothetical protein